MTYSAELIEVIDFSKREAIKLNYAQVHPKELLLGLMNVKSKAYNILQPYRNYIMDEINLPLNHTLARTTLQEKTLPFSPESVHLLHLSCQEAQKKCGANVQPEHLLLSMINDKSHEASSILLKLGLNVKELSWDFHLTHKIENGFGFAEEMPDELPEDSKSNSSQPSKSPTHPRQEKSDKGTPIIDKYGIDLTALAEEGALDPVVGRMKETERIAQILSRRKKNNPILIGEPGVGKSAIVEGLANLISTKKVPHNLIDKRIVSIDMASMVAGTQYRGQFEERLRSLIQELRSHNEIILFIDEIHTIIGAGSAPGSLDAANILKPALARGELQCIGATTIGEYKKSIEKDGALERRFQKILLEPTNAEETLQILKNIRDRYEEHHLVKYTDEALEACVYLTERYITDRSFPDKAIDALDETGSRVHLLGISVPKEIVDKETEIEVLKLQKTEAAKKQDYELAAKLRDAVNVLKIELDVLNTEWKGKLKKECQSVSADDVAEVISLISGVPVHKMLQTESDRLKGIRNILKEKVIDQDAAIDKLSRAITRNRIGLKSSDRPIGTFMFVGPTGVGKTHLVKCLAEWMFGSKDALIRVDMSEYGEKHTTSRLVGAPPGYVGYEEGGQLTEKVRRKPYSIILLDEIEKAHPDVFNTLLQVMDEGRMTDGNGTTVDFRNTIIIMTSNSGTRQLKDFGAGIGFNTGTNNNSQIAESIIHKALQKQFAPEFLNRIDEIIMFQALSSESAQKIAQLEIDEIINRVATKGIQLKVTPQVIQNIVEKGFDAQYGARSLKRSIQHNLEDIICDYLMEQPDFIGTITVDISNGNFVINT